MLSQKILKLSDSEGKDFYLEVEILNFESSVCIKFTRKTNLFKIEEFNGSDFFDALCLLRNEVNLNKYKLLCNGSRIDVYPSGMTRQMNRGITAYVLEMGKKPLIEDKVNIFDQYTDLTKIGTVQDQLDYYKKWIKSVRTQPG